MNDIYCDKIGRPKKQLDHEQYLAYRAQGKTNLEIAALMGVCFKTLYMRIKEWRKEK